MIRSVEVLLYLSWHLLELLIANHERSSDKAFKNS